MTSYSRRAFGIAAAASLLAGCDRAGGGGGARGGGDARAATDVTPAPPKGAASGAPQTRASVRPLARSLPLRLEVAAIGVDTPVVRLGLAADGTVEVPAITAHDRAGWYEHGPTPGQLGPAVMLGHVTVGSYGDGVFRRLGQLRAGDRVVVRLEDATAAEFSVFATRTVAKAEFPTREVYGNVDRPELRLITCGGARDGDGGYQDNVIVFAALTGTGTASTPGAR
ncbi:class F sortase [Streptomyces sp. NBC_00102]|uniref:class F sortase n=1 Tax=Streptomyces sp. NBC_00102 TaxID=2975652 RepID=UPI00225581AE|nr:class F sortase [Streptomyces sp. NBC_00102]MCX5398433.1 class F sortase [Streptomyces sp. NBC_00102]